MSSAEIIVLVGPTASGKSSLAMRLAPAFGAAIVSADSMQIYRGMDIGTAKPTIEERARVPHHLIDVADPDEHFHAGRYQKEADRAIAALRASGKVPFVVGGTGLWVKALLHGLFADTTLPQAGKWRDPARRRPLTKDDPHATLRRLDPEAGRRIHPSDTVRTLRALDVLLRTGRSITELQEHHGFRENRYQALLIGLSPPRDELRRRIETRVDRMMEQGLLEEVRALLLRGYEPTLPSMRALGYRHMAKVLRGSEDLAAAAEEMKRDTKRYAKRQLTWFRHQEHVIWFEAGDDARIPERIQRALEEV
ncbi:MAG: tRNA (adenosine(37)-N6)-dimethylallyltransferase MiaA [bacterium]